MDKNFLFSFEDFVEFVSIFLGVLHHVEIWAKERWEAYRKKARASFEKAAPHLEL